MNYSINFDSTKIPAEHRAKLIKDAGFNSVFIWWSRTDGLNDQRIDAVRNAGLNIETAHTDFWGINNIWRDNLEGIEHFNYYIRTISEAKKAGIPVLIIHLSSGDNPPEVNNIGMERYHKMIAAAEDNGVILAFENLRKVSYLEAMLSSTNSPNAKFCFDIGHENIYNGGNGVLEKYGDRLVALHIHDNHGTCDEHLLPLDGSIDWKTAANRLRPYLEKLNFTIEAYAADTYDENSPHTAALEKYAPETFYTLAMERAKKVLAE